MPQSPIRKLVPYAEAAKKNGTKVYHLNIGQPDIKTPQVALDAVKNNAIEVLSYARSEGSEEYRTKLASYYAKNDIHVNANNIIATTGGSEALLFTIGSITDPGDEIIIPEPFYANYNGFSTASGVKVVPVISKFAGLASSPNAPKVVSGEYSTQSEAELKSLFLVSVICSSPSKVVVPWLPIWTSLREKLSNVQVVPASSDLKRRDVPSDVT